VLARFPEQYWLNNPRLVEDILGWLSGLDVEITVDEKNPTQIVHAVLISPFMRWEIDPNLISDGYGLYLDMEISPTRDEALLFWLEQIHQPIKFKSARFVARA
jgi:hypothetical protein